MTQDEEVTGCALGAPAEATTQDSNNDDDQQDTDEMATESQNDVEVDDEENEERVGLIEHPLSIAHATTDDERETAMMVRVRAPATLQEGFTFVAEVNEDASKTFTCRVPEGGIEEGAMFWAPLPSDFPGVRLQAPFGRWKDGIFDCFSLGFCHPHLWCSLLCSQLQMAQVQTRTSLSCFGKAESPEHTKNTFYIVLVVVLFYIALSSVFSILERPYVETPPLRIAGTKTAAYVIFTLWSVYALSKTRQSVRTLYGIPARQGEDLCCSLMCTCCTVAQLARHTGDYENYPGVCCTETGHPPTAPLVV